MKITVQIMVQTDEGQAEAVREVACLGNADVYSPRRSGYPSPKRDPFWPGWNRAWSSGQWRRSSSKRNGALAAVSCAPAKTASRS